MSYATSPAGTPAATTTGYDKPLPVIDALTKGFWDLAKTRRLAAQVCSACGDVHFPASPVCPKCLSENQTWQPVSGRGRIESWVEFHRAYWPGFAGELPYRVCLIQLEEGPLMVSNLVGEEAEVGDPVQVVFEDVTAEITLPKFQRSA
jgi:uncharacterized OB-fold protein